MSLDKETPTKYPYYTVNNRRFTSWIEALDYWRQHNGTIMKTLDHMTPSYVIMWPATDNERKNT